MKLHEIPKGSKIKVKEGIITFHCLDGLYSFCTVDWVKGKDNVAHLSRFLELEKDEDEEFFKVKKQS